MSEAYVWVSSYFYPPDRMGSCRHIAKKSVSQDRGGAGISPPPGCVPDVVPARSKKTLSSERPLLCQLSQQPPRSQLFLQVPRARAAVTSSVPAWTGNLHLAMETPSMPTGPAINACLHLGSRLAAPPDSRLPTTPPVSLLPGLWPCACDADSSLAGFRAVECTLRFRVEDACSCYREDDSDWVDAWRVQLSFPVDTPLAHQCP